MSVRIKINEEGYEALNEVLTNLKECGPFVALLEFISRPGFDEGIFESYVHLNIVVPAVASET